MPTKGEVEDRAAQGEPITQTEASRLASDETYLTGSGPIKGGTAATAQSLHDKQRNFASKVREVASKPIDEITKEDAAQVQAKEASAQAGVPPGRGSTSAHIQSIADQNEQEGGV